MKSPFFRMLTLSALLVGMFLCVVLALEWWFQREARRQLDDTREAKQTQLAQALALLPRTPATWDATFQKQLGTMLGGQVALTQSNAVSQEKMPAGKSGQIEVAQALPGSPGYWVHLTLAVPATHRLALIQRRLLVAIVVVGLLLMLLPMLFMLPQREPIDGRTQTPWQKTRAEVRGLTHYARISEERGVELQREAGARRRAEEDLQVNRGLLSQAQEERARLGRELHDNICQTLYAVSLTLESVAKKLTPESESAQRLAQCQKELKRLNQEVRAYLSELEPEEMQRQTFADALDQMLDGQPQGPETELVRQLDAETLALIRPGQAAAIVGILREAISNARRHGRAKRITLRAEHSDDSVALAVHDNGDGFDQATSGSRTGHGLANMRTRATELGGDLRVESAPGKGTRILLLLPVASLA